MEGIDILATGKVAADPIPNSLVFILIFVFSIIIGIIIGLKKGDCGLMIIMSSLIGLCIGYLAALFVGIAEIEYYETYKVTISDEVSMNEFMDKYEILNQDGKIYTVKERVTDAN